MILVKFRILISCDFSHLITKHIRSIEENTFAPGQKKRKRGRETERRYLTMETRSRTKRRLREAQEYEELRKRRMSREIKERQELRDGSLSRPINEQVGSLSSITCESLAITRRVSNSNVSSKGRRQLEKRITKPQTEPVQINAIASEPIHQPPVTETVHASSLIVKQVPTKEIEQASPEQVSQIPLTETP
jgi:hypothetical protein